MNQKQTTLYRPVRFRQLSRKSYAVFRSLRREVRIGVLSFATLAFANPQSMSAQSEGHTDRQTLEPGVEMQEVEVTASRVPLTLSQAARTVTVVGRDAIAAAPAQSVNDLLKYLIGVDVRQRGEMGIQTDISIRGGTFDQITLLLNGINVCDPQTGHNAADFPVDLQDIERIEVLEGPAGRVYGSSSLLGAINIVTRTPAQSHAALHVEGGSYGEAGAGARLGLSTGIVRQQLSGSLGRSDGATLNSDYRTGRAFYQGHLAHPQADVSWQAGYSNKDYGANTFYSAKYADQFEHTRKYFASVQAESKGTLRLLPAFYWTQADDRFELIRGDESKVPFNYHRTRTYGLSLNSRVESRWGKTALGAEVRNEEVESTVLGEPLQKPKPIHGSHRQYTHGRSRTNLSLHAEQTVLLRDFTLSAGVVATRNSDWNSAFHLFPGVDASYWLCRDLKVYASWNASLRMPTFTELYYTTNETHQGNKDLSPERMQAYEAGVRYTTPALQASACVYCHQGKDLIDWVRPVDESVFYSMNHTRIRTTGVEITSALQLRRLLGPGFPLSSIQLGYSYIHRNKQESAAYESQYALEYLRHKLVASLVQPLGRRLTLHWNLRWQERVGHYTDYADTPQGTLRAYRPYTLLDAKLQWSTAACQIYAEANNLLSHSYMDHGNIPQPRFQARAGMRWLFQL